MHTHTRTRTHTQHTHNTHTHTHTHTHQLGFHTPPNLDELSAKSKDLQHLRNHVLLVVRDYNAIIDMLSESERVLFKDRIRFVDNKIKPGLTKLTWSSKGISECVTTRPNPTIYTQVVSLTCPACPA
jgi:hypothetical protein